MKIRYSKSALKFLEKCEKILYKRIIEKIKSLSNEPFPQDCKRISGRKEKVFRIRVGNYRILYVVFNEEIFVTEINKRSRAYEKK